VKAAPRQTIEAPGQIGFDDGRIVAGFIGQTVLLWRGGFVHASEACFSLRVGTQKSEQIAAKCASCIPLLSNKPGGLKIAEMRLMRCAERVKNAVHV
jgi:hypothetical protein